MRTVALIISIIAVVVLNANFFAIYRAIASDPVKKAFIVQQGPAILEKAAQENRSQGEGATNPSAAATPSPTPSASPSPAASPSAAISPVRSPAQTAGAGGASPQPTPAATATPTTIADVKEQGRKVDELVKTYESFGIKPLSRQQLNDFMNGNYLWRDVSETVIGWAIMVMLLSAGAPFWQDTLESLFGLKNLLRQKSDTKNVEEGKGGQPKP
jgi:hypothetical protein